MSATQKLIKQTDQCVMCGLCLPHCPTYLVSQTEGESPRGRISLIKAFAEGELSASHSLENHLQSCTGCMSCQNVCPANVPYQEIIDQGRAHYLSQLRLSERVLQKLSVEILTHSWGHSMLGLARHFKAIAPVHFKSALSKYSRSKLDQTKKDRQTVTVFSGCTGNVFDQETLASVIKMLEALNINANIPSSVFCCGALAQHSGQPKKAQQQLEAFASYLNPIQSRECVSIASGCGQQLNLFADEYKLTHYDIHDYIVRQARLESVTFKPLAKKALVHTPCSMTQSSIDNMFSLLKMIPDIQLINFNDGLPCCGAGGMQLLTPRQSNLDLLSQKLRVIEEVHPDIIVSANIGCSLHLLNGLYDDNRKETNNTVEVIHPMTLLSNQLKT
ncbi:MAG: (Fe-S)-binding protein [Pseudomonadota bacterium]